MRTDPSTVPTADASAVPVELSASPKVVDGKRVLGVVPGKPIAGERKVIDRDDSVMVWPHLLVRHAVAAMVTLLTLSDCCMAPILGAEVQQIKASRRVYNRAASTFA